MNEKVLLGKCITLLYRESLLERTELNSADLVKTALDFIKLPDMVMEVNSESIVVGNLKALAMSMCDNVGSAYDPSELVQEIKIGCSHDTTTAESLSESIMMVMEPKGLKISVTALSKQLSSYFRDNKSGEILSKAYQTYKFKKNTIKDMKTFISDLCSALEPFTVGVSKADPNIVAEYNLSDRNAVSRAFQRVEDFNDGAALMVTGLQGINDMFAGGLRRGMSGVVYAKSHHGKSLVTTGWFKDFCTLNTPYMIDPTKKPCNIHLTFENEVEENIDLFYKLEKENETGIHIDELPPQTSDEKAEYLATKLGVTGYTPFVIRVKAGTWGYREICNYILGKEAEGYEIHACVIDYLWLADKTGLGNGVTGNDLQTLLLKVRAFMSAKSILFITPHQLNSEVSVLARGNEDNIVKELPQKGYGYMCKSLENECDFELFVFLVKKNNKYYFTFARGKHRSNNPAPIEKHYTCYESHHVGRLRSDLKGPCRALKKPGGRPVVDSVQDLADEFAD